MDDASFVRGLERFGDLLRDRNRFLDRQRTSLDARRERLTVDELEDEESMPIGLFETVNASDVLMIQGGEHLRFPAKARQPLGITRHAIWQRFHRDVPAETCIPRTVHLSHAARAEQVNDFVRTQLHSWNERHRPGLYGVRQGSRRN